jgi:hypothetical protein
MLQVVSIVGVAAVDHDVTGLEGVGQFVDHPAGDLACGDHHPDDPRSGKLVA